MVIIFILNIAPAYSTHTPQITNLSREFVVSIQVQPALDSNVPIQQSWMNSVQDLGLSWIGVPVRWADIEPVQGQYDWKSLDVALGVAYQSGIQVMISVFGTPDWASQTRLESYEFQTELKTDSPPTDNQYFTNFLSAMLNRYPNLIHAIEIWKQPNLIRGWNTIRGVNANDYLALLQASSQMIASIDPNIIIISSSFATTGVNIDDNEVMIIIDDIRYLGELIQVGLLDVVDCVGVEHNGYNISPSAIWDSVPNDPTAIFRGAFDNPHPAWSFRSTLEIYADKIRATGSEIPLCVTGFGWGSSEDLNDFPQGYEFVQDNTLQEQADWTIEALNNMEEWGFVWIANIWNLNYAPQNGWDTMNEDTLYSLIGPNFINRPVFDVLSEWNRARLDG
jgi:hypothetical protein